MIKKLECDYIVKSGIPTLWCSYFPTYNKASISLTLGDISCYLQGSYIESSFYLAHIGTYKNVLLNFKRRTHRELCNSVQCWESWDKDARVMCMCGVGWRRTGDRKQNKREKNETVKHGGWEGNAHETLRDQCVRVGENEWTVVSTGKPLERLCERVLLSLRLVKEHKQPWSDTSFSWRRFNMPAFSATFNTCPLPRGLLRLKEILAVYSAP